MRKDQLGQLCKGCEKGVLEVISCKATSFIYKNSAGQVVKFEHSGAHTHGRFASTKRNVNRPGRTAAAASSAEPSPQLPSAPLPSATLPPARPSTPPVPRSYPSLADAALDHAALLGAGMASPRAAAFSLYSPRPPPTPVKSPPISRSLRSSLRGRSESSEPSFTPRRSVRAVSPSPRPFVKREGTPDALPDDFRPTIMTPSQLSPQAKRRLAEIGISLDEDEDEREGDDEDDDEDVKPVIPALTFSPKTSPTVSRLAALSIPSGRPGSSEMSQMSGSSALAGSPTLEDLDPSKSFDTFAGDVFGAAWSQPYSPVLRSQSGSLYIAPDQTFHRP